MKLSPAVEGALYALAWILGGMLAAPPVLLLMKHWYRWWLG